MNSSKPVCPASVTVTRGPGEANEPEMCPSKRTRPTSDAIIRHDRVETQKGSSRLYDIIGQMRERLEGIDESEGYDDHGIYLTPDGVAVDIDIDMTDSICEEDDEDEMDPVPVDAEEDPDVSGLFHVCGVYRRHDNINAYLSDGESDDEDNLPIRSERKENANEQDEFNEIMDDYLLGDNCSCCSF